MNKRLWKILDISYIFDEETVLDFFISPKEASSGTFNRS